MSESNPQPTTGARGPERIHQRSADPQDSANRPMEPKSRPEQHEDHSQDEEAHHALSNPADDADPTAAGDPYERDPEAGDPPPPGEYPGPGPEPEQQGR